VPKLKDPQESTFHGMNSARKLVSGPPLHKASPEVTDQIVYNDDKIPPSHPLIPRINIDPGVTGPYATQYIGPYSFVSYNIPALKFYGTAYVSAQVGPVVLIYPADGAAPDAQLGYDSLAKHLISHGFHVATIGLREPGQVVIQDTIRFIYNDLKSAFKLKVLDQVFVIGHSAGGRVALENVHLVSKPKILNSLPRTLKGLILFAPAFAGSSDFTVSAFESIVPRMDSTVKAFLAITAIRDKDPQACGVYKDYDSPMPSNFLVYDRMGTTGSTKATSTVEKDMIFTEFVSPPTEVGQEHYFQNDLVTKAYVTAFLHRHAGNNAYYEQFLKMQIRPPSLEDVVKPIWQQHEERDRIVAVDNDLQSLQTSSIEKSETGIVAIPVEKPWQFDQHNPHATGALYVYWSRKSTVEPTWFKVKFDEINIVGYKYLSFRVGQVYLEDKVGQELDMTLSVNSSQKTTKISQHSSKIPFPVKTGVKPYIISPEVDITKNAMRTYVIPLSALGQLLIVVNSIRFDLSLNPPSYAFLWMDSISFWK
jgi:pimeloyl-ACP methyl ester carboxylesterase